MKLLRRAWRRLAGVLAGARQEDELAAEIESHIELQTEANLKLGMAPAEARRAALLKFGGVESAKESYRDQRGLPRLETLLQDARYALRGMRRSPGFAAVGVLSLALGIGAATAVFSVVNATLLRPLPYWDAGRLVVVAIGGVGSRELAISAPLFEEFRRDARSLDDAALFINWNFDLAGEGEPERIPAARVSASLFPLLGAQAQLGRTFTAGEDQAGGEPVVLISDMLWKRRFNGDRGVVGRKVVLNGQPYTIIGVMPPEFQFPYGPELPYVAGFPPAQIWRPLALMEWERTCLACFNFAMIGRVKPGVYPAQAQTELNASFQRMARANGGRAGEGRVLVRGLRDAMTLRVRSAVLILLGAVTAVLLIACVNVANLLIGRGLKRQTEIAVRLSLGAARGRIVRQLFTESLVLALSAALLAIPLAWAGVHFLVAIAPPGVFGLDAATVDGRVLAFGIVAALLTSLLFGAVPAFETARHDPAETIKGGGRTASLKRSHLRPALVIAEIAVSLILLVSSALLVKSFVQVARTPLGFHAENVLTMQLSLPNSKFDSQRRAALVERLAANCASFPGVTAAAAVSTLPLTGESEGHGMVSDAHPDKISIVRFRAITPAYFRTLGIRLLAGREFTPADRGADPVGIVSQTTVRQLWPGMDPASVIGRRISDGQWKTVIGVVEDTRASGLDADVRPYIYVPFRQFSPADFALAVRSTAAPARLAGAVKAEIRRIDKDQPITHVAVMKQLVADSIASRRYPAVLVAAFAAFALALAAIGVYGVVSYSVAQRTHEIGIRVALGASRLDVLASVMKEASALALAGSVIGLGATFFITPLLRGLLYNVSPLEPAVFAASALALMAVATVACLVPARRAVRLDPMACLRCD